MGWLDDVKKKMEKFQQEVTGSSTSSSSKSNGKVLGGSSETLSIVFSKEGPLEMVVSKQAELAVVGTVTSGSVADKAGMLAGDVIVRVNSTSVSSYNDFVKTWEASRAKRPLELGIKRAALLATNKKISDSERDARRAAQAKAALERDGAWAKRVSAPKRPQSQQQAKNVNEAQSKKSTNPETIAAWKAAEKRADATVKELGYDPFKPLSTGSGVGTTSRTGPASATAGEPLEEEEETLSSKEDAEAYDRGSAASRVVVDSLREHEDKSQVATCVNTLLKILENAANKDDDKFRRVRLGNAAIQAKILAVPGGLEALSAAGFELAEDPEDLQGTILHLPADFNRSTLRAVTDSLNAFKSSLVVTAAP